MPVDYQRSTSGGKGNIGMFIERDPRICAAGLPSAQPDESIAKALQRYQLKDEVDALFSDAIVPPSKPRPLPPLRYPIPLDKRNAGPFGDVAAIVNPPNQTKFQNIVDDVKDTAYSSYWKKGLGQLPDPVPMLPPGFDIEGTTFGKKTPYHGRLYDLVMPKDPLPDTTPASKGPGVQVYRNYCAPSFDADLTYGYKTGVDKRGTYVKCALTDNRVLQGTSLRGVINFTQANHQHSTQSRLGAVLAPNDNIKDVPPGYAFGHLKPPDNINECLSFCRLNADRSTFMKCFAYLNSIRKILSKRYTSTFFIKLYLNLKYFDTKKSGWLPKNIIYDFCALVRADSLEGWVRFDPTHIEPLLSMWNAFDGQNIEYKTFCTILNAKEPMPNVPKIPDIEPECLDFRTTYTEMVKPGQESDRRKMAGVPSGKYFDKDYPVTPDQYCKAHRTCLLHESDMKSCLSPSILTQVNVSHRDMFAKREPHIVRRVFEAAGQAFTDESFNAVWEKAKKCHSQGWVCYETFRMAIRDEKDP